MTHNTDAEGVQSKAEARLAAPKAPSQPSGNEAAFSLLSGARQTRRPTCGFIVSGRRTAPMPHYHFNCSDGHRMVVDEEGEGIPNKDAARRQAIKSAADAVKH